MPRWAEDNPTRGNTAVVRMRLQSTPGTQVELFVSGNVLRGCSGTVDVSAKADESGIATADIPVVRNADTYIWARARSGAANVSGCTQFRTYTDDSTAPRAPQWSASLPKHANGNTLSLTLTVQPESRLSLFDSGDCKGQVLATTTAGPSAGTITFPVTVEDDTTSTFSVSAADELGNTSCSSAFTYVEDSTPPAVPVLSGTDPVSPSTWSQPKFLGAAEPGASVQLFKTEDCSGEVIKSDTADTRGHFEIPVSVVSNGQTTLRARAKDGAGNVSGCSEPLSYLEDSIAPAEPTFQRFVPPPPANDNTPLLVGTSEPGTQVRIFSGHFCEGMPVALATTDSAGLFQAELSVVDDVTLEFSASARDAAGNVGSCLLSRLQYREDSTGPAVASNVRLSPASPSNSNTVTVLGSAEQGTAFLFRSPNCQGEPVATAPSDFSFSLRLTVPDDSTTQLSVATRDTAGNLSACAGPLSYVEDSTPPQSAGATVTDGPGEDLSYQLVGHTVEAHWEGFFDASELKMYEYFLTASPACLGRLTGTLFPREPRVRVDGLALEEGTYFHCVRAIDAASNFTAWVVSNGFRVDLQPPAVVSTLPAQGEPEADIVAPIRFTFSEPVESSTVNSSTLTVRIGGAPVAGTVACPSPTVCTFTPAGPLPYQEQVEVTLSPAVRDLAARPLASAYTLGFTTRGRQWLAQPAAVSAARPALFPEVAMDGQGRALAVWVQGVGESFRLYTAGYVPFVGWGPPQELGPQGPGDAEQPVVAMNAAGRAVAAWVLRNGGAVDLYAAEYAPGGSWSAPQLLESRAEAVSAPRVAVDGAGNARVVWRQSDGAAESVWAASLSVGVGWSAPLLLEVEPGAVSAPTLAAGASGEAWAAWTQRDGTGQLRVRASHAPAGAGWSSAEGVAGPVAEATVAVALSQDGSAVIVFRRPQSADSNSLSAWATRFVPGAGWSTASELGPSLGRAEDVSVAMDRWGRALVAWIGAGSQSTQTLQLQRFIPAEGWARLDVTRGSSGQPTVAADGQGNFHVLWVENTGGIDRVMQLRSPEGSIAPTAPRPLEPEHTGTSKRPRVVANPAGGAAAVWYRDNGTGFFGNLVYASLFQ
jgi:hypothetical protein